MKTCDLMIALAIGLFLGTIVSRQINSQKSDSCNCK